MKHSSSMLSIHICKWDTISLFNIDNKITLLFFFLNVIIVLFAHLHVLLDNKVMSQQSIRAFIRIARSFSSVLTWSLNASESTTAHRLYIVVFCSMQFSSTSSLAVYNVTENIIFCINVVNNQTSRDRHALQKQSHLINIF